MSNKLIKYKFRNEYFAGYGLNKFKNFMQAPICECGCGGTCEILLNDNKELFGFMNEMLLDNDCDCCAVFAHSYDGKMFAAIKCIGEDMDLTQERVRQLKDSGIEKLQFKVMSNNNYSEFKELY